MEQISLFFQVVVAVSVLVVWVFRYHNVIKEFEQFGFSNVFRNFVGASKILHINIIVDGHLLCGHNPLCSDWHGSFMLAVQISHLRVKNPFLQRHLSLVFLLMSAFVALFHYGLI